MRTLLALGMVVKCVAIASAQSYQFSTIAGSGVAGGINNTGRLATFNYPSGIALDNKGNAYIADSANHAIRKLDSSGNVQTLAGLVGTHGSADGTGSEARFYDPYGIVAGRSGVLFVADTGNHLIRMLTTNGAVTTIAGKSGVVGSADGMSGEATFNSPGGIAVDASTNIYIGDTFNYTIRKLFPNGQVVTLAGKAGTPGFANGFAGTARFGAIAGVDVDSRGNVFVADFDTSTIRMITPDGIVSTLAGSAYNQGRVDGAGPASRFNHPAGIAVDRIGNLYVTDYNGDTIRKVSPNGVVSTIGGTYQAAGAVDGVNQAATFNNPIDIAIDDSGGVFVVDKGNHMIRKGTPILPLQVAASAGGKVSLTWPSWAADYILQARPALGDTNAWTTITNGITSDTNNFTYILPPTNSAAFFRVRSP